MTIIKEVLDGLDTVANAIENIKKINEVVKEGKNYIEAKHPEVKEDLILMINEIRKSMDVIAQASAVLTRFRFAISADKLSSELTRFNDYFIHHKSQAQFLRNHIDDLRGHCSKIREHAVKISDKAITSHFTTLFAMFGLNSPQREEELGEKLEKIAFEEIDFANSSQIMLDCLDRALDKVQNALGDHGAMYPKNVPTAAALLAEYAEAFEALEKPAKDAADDIQKFVREIE